MYMHVKYLQFVYIPKASIIYKLLCYLNLLFIAQVITLREVRSPIHFNQDAETVLQEIKSAVYAIKATVHEIKEQVSHLQEQSSHSQPRFQQPNPNFHQAHFQPPVYQNYEQTWYMEDQTPPPLPPSLLPPPSKPLAPTTPIDDVKENTEEFTFAFLMDVKSQSCSRANLASKLVKHLFTKEERKNSNVKGVVGKSQLDPKRLIKIKESVFQIWPCETGETQSSAWNQCCKAIDEAGRRLNKKKAEL